MPPTPNHPTADRRHLSINRSSDHPGRALPGSGLRILILPTLLLLLISVSANGQDQDAPTGPAANDSWKGNFGAGFSLTGGNTDTASYNLSFEAVRDANDRNVVKLNGFYLRAEREGERTADRLGLGLRDEYSTSNKNFVYFDIGYVRDPFREISYLLNPQAGFGYKVLDGETAQLLFDGGVGVVWEKNIGMEIDSSGSVNAGQSLTINLAEKSKLVQRLTGIWKMQDFEDSLYHFGVGISTRLTSRIELKVEFLDDFQYKPSPGVKKNDTAFLTSFLFRF